MVVPPDKKLILLTNDDGIRSPGLWAAAEALAPLGYVVVAAPTEQRSGAGRSMPSDSGGQIHLETVSVGGRAWQVYAVEGTPAQAVQHSFVELLPRLPDLVVAGINYGENVGSGVTISGTVGATLEAASFNVRGLAISLETDSQYHLSHSEEVDFRTAGHFTRYFAQRMLGLSWPDDMDLLKVEVPAGATPETPWRLTRISRTRYYLPKKPARENLIDEAKLRYDRQLEPDRIEPDSDVKALVDGVVAVTPMSLDLTSRADPRVVEALLRGPNGTA